MNDYIVLGVLGLALGALYAGLGMGVVATFRGTGVVNLGQVGIAMWGAFVTDELQRSGALVLPWVGPGSRLELGAPWRLWPAVAVGVLSAAAVGALAHWLVFRPLRNAPPLARIVATVGLLLTMQALLVHQFGNETRTPAALLTERRWEGFVDVPADRLFLAGVTLALALGLALVQKRTLVGVAVRASSEDETAVALAGWSPDVLATLSWASAGAVSALLAILAAPSLGLSPATFPVLLVPGLACALVGRLVSVTGAACAGLVLGAFQAQAILLTSQEWWPDWARSGFGDAVPFLVVAGVLIVTGRSLPERGTTVTARLPRVPRERLRWSTATAAFAGGLALLVLTSGSQRFGLITSMILGLITLSLVVVTGLLGQVSLAQTAVAGVAAFAMVRLTPDVPFPVDILLATAVATVVGVLIGAPSLRVRHGQLAVITLAAAVSVEAFVFRNNILNPLDETTLPSPSIFGLDLSVRVGTDIARLSFGVMVLIVLSVACVVVAQVTRGSIGARFLAVRADERAAAAAGVPVARTKMLAFAMASALAGLGGCLLAYSRGQASAESFAVMASVSVLVYAYLGGITSVTGALVGAAVAPGGFVYVFLNRELDLGTWYGLVTGVGLLLAIVTTPEGAAGAFGQVWRRVTVWPPRRAIVVRPPPPPADTIPVRPAPDGVPALEVHGLSVRYGGVTAVNAVSFQVFPGEVVGLIGANGAGKSSLIDAITGFAPSSGSVVIAGCDVSSASTVDRYRAGLARTWQSTALFPDLSVRDNLAVAAQAPRFGDLARDVLGRRGRSTTLDSTRLMSGTWELSDRQPGTLSTGQQRIVALGRALAGAPTVVLADEPAAGLDPQERPALGARLRALAAVGVGVLLVEHDLELVLRVCDRIIVLDVGEVIAAGKPEEVRSDPAVVTAYLGAPAAEGVEA